MKPDLLEGNYQSSSFKKHSQIVGYKSPPNFDNCARPMSHILQSLGFLEYDFGLIYRPFDYRLQSKYPSVFELLDYNDMSEKYCIFLEFAKEEHETKSLSIIHYATTHLLLSKSDAECNFILRFLLNLDLSVGIQAFFDVIMVLTEIVEALSEEPLFDTFEAFDRFGVYGSFLMTMRASTPAELISKLSHKADMVVHASASEIVPVLHELSKTTESTDTILFFFSLANSLIFKKRSHAFSFLNRLCRFLVQFANDIEPYNGGYFSTSLRRELAEHLVESIGVLAQCLIDKPHDLGKLLLPFDLAVDFNLKLRNMQTEILSVNTPEVVSVIEELVDMLVETGIWSHSDFYVSPIGKRLISEFDIVYFQLLSTDRLDYFHIREFLLMKLLQREFPLTHNLYDLIGTLAENPVDPLEVEEPISMNELASIIMGIAHVW